MSRKGARADLPASIRARLANLSRTTGVEFQRMLSDFAIKRFLYRLGVSDHADRFILKGAMLFRVWSAERHRATWDLDLQGRDADGIDDVVAVVQDLCSITPRREAYPVLLDQVAPRILTYPRESVVAEKLEAMLSPGVTNSRMKDFFDVQVLASSFDFEGPLLADAIRSTFERRGPPIPDAEPLVLTREFLGAPERQTQWRAFLRRGRLEGPTDAGDLADGLWRFLGPVLDALRTGDMFGASWPAGGPWTQEMAS